MSIPYTDRAITGPDHEALGRLPLVSAVTEMIGRAAGDEALTDDLDRCLPDTTLGTLENIKAFLETASWPMSCDRRHGKAGAGARGVL